jgi:hypothetical protein
MLTLQRLKERLSYDPDTGIFVWNATQKQAGTKNSRYVQIAIDRKIYYAHRLAWMYMFDSFPALNIDHINNNKKDNRITNLRLVTVSENGQNRGKQLNNTSGYKGVSWAKKSKKWEACIRKNGKTIHLGFFINIEDAYECYKQAAKIIHTHNKEVENV